MSKEYETISLLSDIHGNINPILKWNNLVENSVLIQLGDDCIVHYDYHPIAYKLEKRNNKLLVLRGNHYSVAFDGSSVGDKDSVTFVSDYTVLNLNDKNFLFIGGAVSLDRKWRREYRQKYPFSENWYREDEALPYDEEKLSSLPKIDFLLTHTGPKTALTKLDPNFVKKFFEDDDKLFDDLALENKNINQIYKKISEQEHTTKGYFGHFHLSETGLFENIPFRCLDINEIVELI